MKLLSLNKSISMVSKFISSPDKFWYLKGFFYVLIFRKRFVKISFPLKKYKNVCVLNKGNIEFGENITLANNCYLSPVSLKIGNNCWLGVNNFICGTVVIGNDVHLGPNVCIPGATHNINSDKPISKSGSTFNGTIIEDYVWVGSNVTIADGVTIGKGAVVSANSFVNKDVPTNTVVGGVPAKFLKKRIRINENY